jgi:hypothetical protein
MPRRCPRYVRREDEVPTEGATDGSTGQPIIIITVGGDAGSPDAEASGEDDGIKPLVGATAQGSSA